MCIFKTYIGGWTTSSRMHEHDLCSCLLGCRDSKDNINHYFNEKKISKTIIDFCIKNNIKYIDGFNKLRFIKEDTWDLVHTSPSGSEKIADLIYGEIKTIFHKF